MMQFMSPVRTFSLLLSMGLMLGGCASVNSVAVSSIPANRSQQVSAEASRWIILGLNFNNDYVDEMAHELGHKCQNGRISGILTKDEYYDYFLMLVLKRHVVATGYCEKHNKTAAAPAQPAHAPASVPASAPAQPSGGGL